ncbi:phosphatase [Lithospermum erythrorhizon]|uniref:Phosphatase n=1 Tax=Lithospermum erythrorhizon TaxID=34254 RepID=A0AAV3RYH0_LITER
MPEVKHTVASHGGKLAKNHLYDWLLLLLLVFIDGGLNLIEPFHRYVNEDIVRDLKFPFKHDTVPMWAVPIYAVILPLVVFMAYYLGRRDVYDLHHAILGLAYSVLISAVVTDSIKDAVGRPRPNFFWRCFPDGIATFDPTPGDNFGNVMCTGVKKIIKEGYKSFPSGHSSWSFAGLGYLGWYLCGKIRAFDRRGHSAKLTIVLIPYLFAALVAVSRVDDYWHHWTDVVAGSLIGIGVSSVCYLQFFPFPNSSRGWATHAYFRAMEEHGFNHPEDEFQYKRSISMPDLEIAMENRRRS